jgi:hypothetical protein
LNSPQTNSWTSQLSKAVSFIEENLVKFIEPIATKHIKNKTLDTHQTVNELTDILMTQMTAKKGIKEYGDRAIRAIVKEYDQSDK